MDGTLAAEVEAINSNYEDALEEEGDDLGKLCEDARRHIKRHESRQRGKPLFTPVTLPSSSPGTGPKRSSSSEHSSIEKLAAGVAGPSSFRSRQGTASSRYRRSRTKQKSGSSQSHSNDVTPPEELRLVNYAFHDVSSYGIMLQLSQQLQFQSRQLYEMETTSAMQLKIMTRMLQVLIEMQDEMRMKALPRG